MITEEKVPEGSGKQNALNALLGNLMPLKSGDHYGLFAIACVVIFSLLFWGIINWHASSVWFVYSSISWFVLVFCLLSGATSIWLWRKSPGGPQGSPSSLWDKVKNVFDQLRNFSICGLVLFAGLNAPQIISSVDLASLPCSLGKLIQEVRYGIGYVLILMAAFLLVANLVAGISQAPIIFGGLLQKTSNGHENLAVAYLYCVFILPAYLLLIYALVFGNAVLSPRGGGLVDKVSVHSASWHCTWRIGSASSFVNGDVNPLA